MNLNPAQPRAAKSQAGIALLLCLLFLTALTLLGLSASADAILQNQLAANLHESERAKQSALAALSWAEDWLLALQGTAPQSCSSPCEGFVIHLPGDLPPHPEFRDLSWWQTQGFEAGIDPVSGNRLATIATGSVNPPMWIIEVVHESPALDDGTADTPADTPANTQAWYRILARASGQTEMAISVVESTVTRSWPSADGSGSEGGGIDTGRVSWRQLR